MNRCSFSYKVVCVAVSSMLSLYLAACSDVQEAQYAGLAEAAADGAIKRGWIPDWLPPEARDIREAHDLDSNRFMVRFHVAAGMPLPLPAACREVGPQGLPKPLLRANWWPDEVPAASDAKARHEYAACADGYIAYSESSGEGFFWK